jgi:hypothetical protein
LNLPSYYDRYIRTTKFPRIGRSSLNSEESSSVFDTTSEENSDENNQSRLIEQRSVLFPRIGKRAFHNVHWANILSSPYRMLDAQGRYYVSDYDYHTHPNAPQSSTRYRGKRNIAM